MTDYMTLLQRHRKSGALLDTNLLLLYFVGLFNQEEIPRFKRTEKFVIEDYSTLLRLFKYFEKIVTTPNILTEVSNLLGQLAEHLRLSCFGVFAHGITVFDERYSPSANISKTEEFRRFGLTDAGISHLAEDNYLVITDDFRLSQYLQSKGIDVLNFNHIRTLFWEYSE